jgi:hypothetical protein
MLCWVGAGAIPALAGELDLGAGLALTRESNVTKTSDPRADQYEQLFAGLAYQERSAELYARLVAQVERRNYARDSFPDDNGYYFDGTAVWTISPRLFIWSFEDVFQEVNLTLSSPDTPTNRTRTNSLSTGPEFTFTVNPTNTPVIGARYGRYDVQNGIGDNERNTIYARWLNLLTTSATLSLNVVGTRIYFAPPALYTDLSRGDLFLRYDLVTPFNRQMVDAGTSRVKQYGGQGLDGRLFRYTGEVALTSESAMRVVLADQFSDTYSDTVVAFSIPTLPSIQGEATAAPLAIANVAAAGDVYRSRRGELAYSNRIESFGFTLQGYVRSVDFASVPQDYIEKGGRFSLSWLFSAEVQPYAFAQYMARKFSDTILQGNELIHEEDIERRLGAGASYRLSRSLTLAAEAGREQRESNVIGASYVNRRAMLLLGYSTGPLYSARSRR